MFKLYFTINFDNYKFISILIKIRIYNKSNKYGELINISDLFSPQLKLSDHKFNKK